MSTFKWKKKPGADLSPKRQKQLESKRRGQSAERRSSESASLKQIELMQKLNIQFPKHVYKRDASYLIDKKLCEIKGVAPKPAPKKFILQKEKKKPKKSWEAEPATDKQLNFLKMRGVPILPQITKGQASLLIDGFKMNLDKELKERLEREP